MSAKDYLIRILSVDMAFPEKTIAAIVDHQFQSANEAMDTNKSLEISGFARFMFNDKKAIKKMATLHKKLEYYTEKLEDNYLTEANRVKITEIIRVINKQIVQLKPKLNHDEHL
jgi:nucleoid DNA-binding protein